MAEASTRSYLPHLKNINNNNKVVYILCNTFVFVILLLYC